MEPITVQRKTKETEVDVTLGAPGSTRESPENLSVDTRVPFFDHMLYAMLFHGGFAGSVRARGDTDVDDHHTVEDVGIVIGQALSEHVERFGPVARFGHAVVPMDDALAETVIDLAGRSFLAFRAEFPQARAGRFDLALVREFFQALAGNARANVHVIGHYGINAHHLSEAIFKSAGRALGAATRPADLVRSTKGTL